MSVLYEEAALILDEIELRTRSHPMHARHKYTEITFDHVLAMDVRRIDEVFVEAVSLGYINGPVSDDQFVDPDTGYTLDETVLNYKRAIAYVALEKLMANILEKGIKVPRFSRASSDMVHEIADGDAEFRHASRGRR